MIRRVNETISWSIIIINKFDKPLEGIFKIHKEDTNYK